MIHAVATERDIFDETLGQIRLLLWPQNQVFLSQNLIFSWLWVGFVSKVNQTMSTALLKHDI